MFFKKFKKSSLLLLILLIIPINTLAYSKYIIPGGENIGISINSKGIIIVGKYKVNGINTLKNSELEIGDTITKINNENTDNINEMVTKLKNCTTSSATITYLRNNKYFNTKLKLIKDEGIIKTGLYVKDSITGIGTLSFIDPNTKYFGALGHEVAEKIQVLFLK